MRSLVIILLCLTVLPYLLTYGFIVTGSFIDNNGNIDHTLNTVNRYYADEISSKNIRYNPTINLFDSYIDQYLYSISVMGDSTPTTFDLITLPFNIAIRTIKGILTRNYDGKLPW